MRPLTDQPRDVMRVVKEILLDQPKSAAIWSQQDTMVSRCRIVNFPFLSNIQNLLTWHNANKAMLQLLTLLIFSTSFAISPVVANEYPEQIDTASVNFVKGQATINRRHNDTLAVMITRGMIIHEQDKIMTGDDGFVSISFASGSVVSIQPSSEIHVEQLDCAPDSSQCNIIFNAVQGSINSSAEHSGNATVKFIINTPYASAAVRGTVFDVDVNDGRLLTGVTQGQVNVSSERGLVELPENFGTKVLPDQPPAPPKPLLPSPELIPGPSRFDTDGALAWNQVPLASEYLIAFGNEEGLVYRTKLDETQHRLKPLDIGTYAMRIRAIDEEGFLGNVAIRDFAIVGTNESRKGPLINATTSQSEFEVVVEQQPLVAELVELQFSTSREFNLLSSLDVALNETVSAPRANNTIYVRARGVLSNTEVTLFGPTVEIPPIE